MGSGWRRQEEEETSKRSQIYEAKKLHYDDQIVNWKNMAEPGHMLVFILCGASSSLEALRLSLLCTVKLGDVDS